MLCSGVLPAGPVWRSSNAQHSPRSVLEVRASAPACRRNLRVIDVGPVDINRSQVLAFVNSLLRTLAGVMADPSKSPFAHYIQRIARTIAEVRVAVYDARMCLGEWAASENLQCLPISQRDMGKKIHTGAIYPMTFPALG